MEPVDAITIASRNCFQYYGMGDDLGGVAPGKLADILVFDDLERVRPDKVFVGGRLVVAHGSPVFKATRRPLPGWLTNTVRVGRRLAAKDFEVRARGTAASATVIRMETEIITRKDSDELSVRDGNVLASRDKDVWKVAAMDRTYGTGKRCVGFLKNLGADIGAFGSTQSFHENDLIVIGSDEGEMALVANELLRTRGGLAVSKGGRILAGVEMPVAGLASMGRAEDVAAKIKEFDERIVEAGCGFAQPHLIPLFLPFLALPEVRILYSGLVDVKGRKYLDVIT